MPKKATNHSTIPKPKKELTPYQRMMQYGLKKNNVSPLTQQQKMKQTAVIYKKYGAGIPSYDRFIHF